MTRRAINVQLARWDQRTRRAVVIVVSPLGLDMGVDGVGDPLVSATRLVLVDHRGPLAVMPHPCHQVLETCSAVGGELVSGMAQVVEVQARQAEGPTAWDQADSLAKPLRRSGPPLTPEKISAPGSSLT